MLNDSSVLKLAEKVLIRFEQNFDGGTLFLYNLETEQVWSGNSAVYNLIKLINNKALGEIYSEIIPQFPNYSISELKESFNSVIEELLNKKFLEII